MTIADRVKDKFFTSAPDAPALSTANIGDLFKRFAAEGNHELAAMRQNVIKPEDRKKARTWGIVEAAPLVGVAINTLRSHYAHLKDPETGKWAFTLDQINEARQAFGTLYQRPAGSKATILAISNFKGGVGKTTSTVHLAQKAAIDGLKVLVVDLDPQASTTFNLGPFIPDIELGPDDIINRALLEDPAYIKRVILKSYFPGISLVPSNLHLQQLDVALPTETAASIKKLGAPHRRLEKALELVRERYDLILLDCGPNMASVSVNAMTACDSLIVPIPPSSYDHASFVMLCSSLGELFSSLNKDMTYMRLLITKHPGGTSKGAMTVEHRIRRLYGEFVLNHVMYLTAEIEKANADMSTVYDQVITSNNRRSYKRAIEILDNVNGEILGELKKIWARQAEEAN